MPYLAQDTIFEEVKNNVEILDISTDEGNLEDIFIDLSLIHI